jgi:hypothetical protein
VGGAEPPELGLVGGAGVVGVDGSAAQALTPAAMTIAAAAVRNETDPIVSSKSPSRHVQ